MPETKKACRFIVPDAWVEMGHQQRLADIIDESLRSRYLGKLGMVRASTDDVKKGHRAVYVC